MRESHQGDQDIQQAENQEMLEEPSSESTEKNPNKVRAQLGRFVKGFLCHGTVKFPCDSALGQHNVPHVWLGSSSQ